jgi:lysozyme
VDRATFYVGIGAGLALLCALAWQRDALTVDYAVATDDPASGDPPELDQAPALDRWLAPLDPSTWWPAVNVDQAQQLANLAAFLATIRKAEGTDGPDGYRTEFGYRYFTSFDDHPRDPAQFTDANGRRLWTSAAGAYQLMAVSPLPGGGSTRVDTWDRLQRKLGLADFSPESQDRCAVELIDEAGALQDVYAGRFDAAIAKVRRTWASLPGAGYGQPERQLAQLRDTFTSAGGSLA